MRIDEVRYSIQHVRKRKLRSWLTIISILIGIAAIFALVSFGIGIWNYVNLLAEESGRNNLFIQGKSIGAPGTDENFFISKDDIDFVSKIKGVDEIVGMYFSAGEIESDDVKKYYYLIVLEPYKINFIQ